MRRLCLYPLIMKGSFSCLHRKGRLGDALRCWEEKKKIQQLQFKIEKIKKNSSPQCSHFLLLGHTPINIYLISNALAHSLFEYLYWISSFFFPTQEFQPFSPLLRNSTKKTKQPQTNKKKILRAGPNVNMIKPRRERRVFPVTRIMLESVTEI